MTDYKKGKKKKDKKHNSSTQAVKSHIIPAILNKYLMKRIILDSLHEHTYEIYRQGGIVIVYISKNKNYFLLQKLDAFRTRQT